MRYRELRGEDTICEDDEYVNPTYQHWFPVRNGGWMYLGKRADETGLQWRRRVTGEPEQSEQPAAPANKYHRVMRPSMGEGGAAPITVDVYDVLTAFAVTCPAIQHAIKKLLCPGMRGSKSARQDVSEAIGSLHRALELIGGDDNEHDDSLQYDAAIEERDKALRECERLTRQLDECRREISHLQKELGSTWQQLTAAEARIAEAAKAGPIVDDRIKKLETHLEAVRADNENMQRSIERYRSEVSFVQNLLGDARRTLAAAEQNLLGDARRTLAAAESMDAQSSQKIRELEAQITARDGSLAVLAGEASALRQLNEDLNHELQRLRPQAMVSFERANHLDLRDDGEPELERRAWELFASAMATEDNDITPEQSFVTARMWMTHRDQQRKAGTP